MENQHRQIKGYRELNQTEIDTMNQIKSIAASLGDYIATMETIPDFDKRWVAIAKTDLQKGFMALTRAVAKPEFF